MGEKQADNILLLKLMGLSCFVGFFSGLLGILFHDLIALFHNLFFAGTFSTHYNVHMHTQPSVWGKGIIIVPAMVSLLVVFLIKNFAPEAKGHGIPEVIDSVFFKEAKLRPVSIWVKALSSALTIGSGGSVGREGPIVQICAAVGSSFAQWLKLPLECRWILLCAGASSGIAATFNAPIAAVLFVMELFMPRITISTLVPVCTATALSTFVGRYYFGIHPAFHLPDFTVPTLLVNDPLVLLSFIPFGIVIGVASIGFIRLLYGAEDFFDRLFENPYLKHVIGMLLVGINLYLWLMLTGHYYLDGIGYSAIMGLLLGHETSYWLLIALCVGKMLSTSITIGSGGSGGIFSPTLFFGAMLGGALGYWVEYLCPGLGLNPVVCAIVGMSAMIGSVTGLFITSMVIVVEMTGGYHSVLPILMATTSAMATRYMLCRESVYTIKLLRRGVDVEQGLVSLNMVK